MELIGEKAIKLALPKHLGELVTSHIAQSEIIDTADGISNLAVYWGLDEMTKLNKLIRLKSNLPSPIRRDYSYPGLYKPFDHQAATAEFLSINEKAFCFNEAGTGKTSSALWAADYLMNQGKIKKVLIICPLSIMYSAWQGDVFNTCMHRTSVVCYGPAHKRKTIIEGDYDFTIINYDGVNIVKDDIKKANFDLIIIDECNAYKSHTTVRWKTLNKILNPDTRVWMMTGTPACQSPVDAFGLGKLICPDRVPRLSAAWREKVMYQISRFKWIPKPDSKDSVFAALQPSIRFAKDECLDLPEVTYQTRVVPLTKQVEKFYKQLKSQMIIAAGGESVTAVNAATGMNKLLQITNDVINGSVSANDRRDIIDKFQTQDEPKVLVIQPQSASHGVTLTAADTVVFWSPVMSVEVYLQCIARIDRVGQKNKMTVVHLQGSDVEKRMYAMLQGKVDQHTKLVDLYREELSL